MPLDKVLAWDDHVNGNLSLAHFNNFSLLLSDGQYTAEKNSSGEHASERYKYIRALIEM
jgi:hypothetical protein